MLKKTLNQYSKKIDKENIYLKNNKIMLGDTVVGRIDLREIGDCVVIESIYISHFFKKQGIGTEIISMLKKKYRTISGSSSPMAINFWKKVGAEFEYEVSDHMIEHLLDIGEYPSFIIKC